jgi:hypothetical protein
VGWGYPCLLTATDPRSRFKTLPRWPDSIKPHFLQHYPSPCFDDLSGSTSIIPCLWPGGDGQSRAFFPKSVPSTESGSAIFTKYPCQIHYNQKLIYAIWFILYL